MLGSSGTLKLNRACGAIRVPNPYPYTNFISLTAADWTCVPLFALEAPNPMPVTRAALPLAKPLNPKQPQSCRGESLEAYAARVHATDTADHPQCRGSHGRGSAYTTVIHRCWDFQCGLETVGILSHVCGSHVRVSGVQLLGMWVKE